MNPHGQTPVSHDINLSAYKFTKERSSIQTSRANFSNTTLSTLSHSPLNQSAGNQFTPSNVYQGNQSANQMFIKPLGQSTILQRQADNRNSEADIESCSREQNKENNGFQSPKGKKHKKVKGNIALTADLDKTQPIFDQLSKNLEKYTGSESKTSNHQDKNKQYTPLVNQNQVNEGNGYPVTFQSERGRLQPSNNHSLPENLDETNFGGKEMSQSSLQRESYLLNNQEEKTARKENRNMTAGFETEDLRNMQRPRQPSSMGSSKTKDLLDKFYQNLNELPNRVQEKIESLKPPQAWNLGKLPFTDMDPEEYMNEDHNIQPQELDLPNDIIEEFKKNIDRATGELQDQLREIHDLFIFSQKTGKLFGDKENETIHRNKEISNAFSDLSHYIWDYLQNQFNFNEGNFSQESSLTFQDVGEKISTQKFLSELNEEPAIDDLLTYFNNLMLQENAPETNEDLRKNVSELISYDILDEELAKYLFGETFDRHAEAGREEGGVTDTNPVEEEFKNQYLAISQDLKHMTDNRMEEEEKSINYSESRKFTTASNKAQKNEQSNMNEEMRSEGPNMFQSRFQDSNQPKVTQNIPTQNTITQPSNNFLSERNTFQQQYVDFEEGFMPLEFDDESNYMTEFPFMQGEEFKGNGLGNENEQEDE